MPYALFENNDRLTRPFQTEGEVWDAAERADLIVVDSRGVKTLDNDFEIKACDAAPDEIVATGEDVFFPDRQSDSVPSDRASYERPRDPLGKKRSA